MIKNKIVESFIEQGTFVKSVTDDAAGKAFKMCFDYLERGEVDDEDCWLIAKAVFSAMKPYMDILTGADDPEVIA